MIERPLEPPESKNKCYIFECTASCKLEISVWADDEETARDYCNLEDCDEYSINQIDDLNIEDYRIEED